MSRFQGRVVLVTGGSHGIGLGIAQRFVADGARACITARDGQGLQAAVTSLGGAERVLAVQGAVDDRDHQQDAVEEALRAFGRVDYLVNNAAVSPGRAARPLVDLDLDLAERVLKANTLAALSWTQVLLRSAASPGSIVNISSFAAQGPVPALGLYGMTKSALDYLTRQLASELGPKVRVNSVAPGTVLTRMSGPLVDGREEELRSSFPLARFGTPEDVAGAVAYLCSDDASWVTGVTLNIDGGLAVGS